MVRPTVWYGSNCRRCCSSTRGTFKFSFQWRLEQRDWARGAVGHDWKCARIEYRNIWCVQCFYYIYLSMSMVCNDWRVWFYKDFVLMNNTIPFQIYNIWWCLNCWTWAYLVTIDIQCEIMSRLTTRGGHSVYSTLIVSCCVSAGLQMDLNSNHSLLDDLSVCLI